jgi:hypothetical protein
MAARSQPAQSKDRRVDQSAFDAQLKQSPEQLRVNDA